MDTLAIIAIGANAAQIILIFIGVWQIWIGRKEARDSRDTELILNYSYSFSEKYYNQKWEEALFELETRASAGKLIYQGRDNFIQEEKELLQMLRWFDWVGTLKREGVLYNDKLIKNSLDPTFNRIMNVGYYIIEREIELYGIKFWRSLIYLGYIWNMDFFQNLKNKGYLKDCDELF